MPYQGIYEKPGLYPERKTFAGDGDVFRLKYDFPGDCRDDDDIVIGMTELFSDSVADSKFLPVDLADTDSVGVNLELVNRL